MKKLTIIFFQIICCALGYTQSYFGTIIRVIDSDTFVFQTSECSFTVRMQGTDAPERDQPFSNESSYFLNKYLNKGATIKASGVERYGRTLGVLYVDGQILIHYQ